MIFSSVNEEKTPAYFLVDMGTKTVTRRRKFISSGAIRSVQPNRTKKGICKIKVLSVIRENYVGESVPENQKEKEALREGFKTWGGLKEWFKQKYGTANIPVYRIEFEKVKT